MTRTYRPDARPETSDKLSTRIRSKRTKGIRSSPLMTMHANVRAIRPTAQGDIVCTLDTPAGRLRAFSDAAAVHLPELTVGRTLEVALLRLRRVTEDAVWHWQLLACRTATPRCEEQPDVHAAPEGRSA